ncbi:predicted protein [Nematostella vectensis]|uniref:Uncharacterized protein n=1 Tax=Nematostella vectensis TaxID=45351 RepID=A7RTE7_NEMVE|nr:uncharacterized protein LOC5517244 [Nematostella vectensis]EDO45198.1 predicted protein [Nematostella vectensis]|eukprot:XP_001637261.1 predicted protein [Nematostella vectensis]
MPEEGSENLYECMSKYLGSADAPHPKIGTLENAAKIYQKGCYEMIARRCCEVRISAECIVIDNGPTDRRTFQIKKTLFCATYKKIPKVVVFNYMNGSMENGIQCHAIFTSSITEAQDFVKAVTTAFSQAYSMDLDGKEIHTKTPSKGKQAAKKHGLWSERITDIFGTVTQCVGKE